MTNVFFYKCDLLSSVVLSLLVLQCNFCYSIYSHWPRTTACFTDGVLNEMVNSVRMAPVGFLIGGKRKCPRE